MVNLYFNGFVPGSTRPCSAFSRCGGGQAARKTTRQQENVAGLLVRNLTSSIESSGQKKAMDVEVQYGWMQVVDPLKTTTPQATEDISDEENRVPATTD